MERKVSLSETPSPKLASLEVQARAEQTDPAVTRDILDRTIPRCTPDATIPRSFPPIRLTQLQQERKGPFGQHDELSEQPERRSPPRSQQQRQTPSERHSERTDASIPRPLPPFPLQQRQGSSERSSEQTDTSIPRSIPPFPQQLRQGPAERPSEQTDASLPRPLPPFPLQQLQQQPQTPFGQQFEPSQQPQGQRSPRPRPGRQRPRKQPQQQPQQSNPQQPPTATVVAPPLLPIDDMTATLSKGKGKAAIRVPSAPTDIEAAWAKLYIENARLRATDQYRETLILRASDTVAHLHVENMRLQRLTAESTPQLISLETQLSDNMSQVSLLEEEVEDESARTTALAQQRAAAQREATSLRRLNNTLVNNLTAERKKITDLESLIQRLKTELDAVVEVRLRFSVLEAENEALRDDLGDGMQQMRLLMQSQQQLSLQLADADAAAEEEAWRAEQEALWAPDWDGDDGGLARIRFRSGSIWEGARADDQAGPARPGDVVNNAGVELVSRGTQMTTTPPALSPSSLRAAAPVVVLGTTTSMRPKLRPLEGEEGDEEGEEESPPSYSSSFPGIPLLLLLLSAFFVALYADRLAAEREVWVAANDAARGLMVGRNEERWGGVVGQFIGWEVGGWCGVKRGLLA